MTSNRISRYFTRRKFAQAHLICRVREPSPVDVLRVVIERTVQARLEHAGQLALADDAIWASRRVE
jgi:hypothetical protein